MLCMYVCACVCVGWTEFGIASTYVCIMGAGRESSVHCRVRGISEWLIYLNTAVAQGCTGAGTFVPKPRLSGNSTAWPEPR